MSGSLLPRTFTRASKICYENNVNFLNHAARSQAYTIKARGIRNETERHFLSIFSSMASDKLLLLNNCYSLYSWHKIQFSALELQPMLQLKSSYSMHRDYSFIVAVKCWEPLYLKQTQQTTTIVTENCWQQNETERNLILFRQMWFIAMHIGFVSINLYLLTICQCDFHSHSKNGQKKIPNELEKKREDEKKRVGSALYSAPIPDYTRGLAILGGYFHFHGR